MLKPLIMAFSTYSRIPMPRAEWDEKSARYSLCFFPLVGAAVGLCSVLCFWGLRAAGAGGAAVAAALSVLPVVMTGGIHMDGFMDTVDAMSSYKPREEKLEILKDPHTGAFASIYGMVYLMLCFGLFSEVTEREIACVAVGYVYSRALSAMAVVSLKKARREGMLYASAHAAGKYARPILAAELAGCALCFLWAGQARGAVCAAAGAFSFLCYRRMAYRVFGGITGDLAGYFLQVCELSILLGAVLSRNLPG